MVRLIFLCLVLSSFALGGCASKSARNAPVSKALDSTDGLCNYLADLPAVESAVKWDNPYTDGLVITTAHYTLYTTYLEPLFLRRLPAFVEAAYSGYQSQLPRPIPTQNKFVMYIFGSRDQWEKFTNETAGQFAPVYLKIKSGAYYLNGSCVAYNLGIQRTFGILGHEGWHQFTNRHFRYRLPSWLDEGIATLFESPVFGENGWQFDPDKNLPRLGALKYVVLSNKALTVEDLISLNPGQVIYENDSAVMAFYAQSYALVRYLREDQYGRRLGNFQQMLLGAMNGTWPLDDTAKKIAADRNILLTVNWNAVVSRKLFLMYISEDFKPIEKDFKLFCKKTTYRIRFN